MDRTVLESFRIDDKNLNEKIFKKLSILSLIHAPSADFKECLSEVSIFVLYF